MAGSTTALNGNTVAASPCDSPRGALAATLRVLGRRLLARAGLRTRQIREEAPPDGEAGFPFVLAGPVEGHPVGTLVHVTVCVPNHSRLVLDFGDRNRVVTDACVLLCGHIGALKLIELGYTGPLIRRPRLAAVEPAALQADLPSRA